MTSRLARPDHHRFTASAERSRHQIPDVTALTTVTFIHDNVTASFATKAVLSSILYSHADTLPFFPFLRFSFHFSLPLFNFSFSYFLSGLTLKTSVFIFLFSAFSSFSFLRFSSSVSLRFFSPPIFSFFKFCSRFQLFSSFILSFLMKGSAQ